MSGFGEILFPNLSQFLLLFICDARCWGAFIPIETGPEVRVWMICLFVLLPIPLAYIFLQQMWTLARGRHVLGLLILGIAVKYIPHRRVFVLVVGSRAYGVVGGVAALLYPTRESLSLTSYQGRLELGRMNLTLYSHNYVDDEW